MIERSIELILNSVRKALGLALALLIVGMVLYAGLGALIAVPFAIVEFLDGLQSPTTGIAAIYMTAAAATGSYLLVKAIPVLASATVEHFRKDRGGITSFVFDSAMAGMLLALGFGVWMVACALWPLSVALILNSRSPEAD